LVAYFMSTGELHERIYAPYAVARLILGDGEAITDPSANKPLATGPDTG
jgi:hypothetical protein